MVQLPLLRQELILQLHNHRRITHRVQGSLGPDDGGNSTPQQKEQPRMSNGAGWELT
jgi:hypothetical protein